MLLAGVYVTFFKGMVAARGNCVVPPIVRLSVWGVVL